LLVAKAARRLLSPSVAPGGRRVHAPETMMATRRRKASNGEDGARAFAVVVEQMRGHFRAFGEKLDMVNDSLSRRIDAVNDSLSRRISELEQRMDARFEQVEGRFEQVEGRLDRIEGRLDRVEDALLQHTRQLKAIRAALDRKVDRDDMSS
jgi:chromosome segregation ATPase